MLINHRQSQPCVIPKHMAGVNLIELMIGLTIGMILMLALATTAANQINSRSTNIKSSLLNGEARDTFDLIAREIKRAGYVSDSGNSSNIKNPTISSSGDCLIFSYYNSPSLAASTGKTIVASGFWRTTTTVNGVTVGVLKYRTSGNALITTCSTASTETWVTLTTPANTDIYIPSGKPLFSESTTTGLASHVVVQLNARLTKDNTVNNSINNLIFIPNKPDVS